MFEVGKKYTLCCIEDSEEGQVTTEYSDCLILESNHPLIKIEQEGDVSIFNTASFSFVEARLS
ncbi:MAG TPA: hypothetical protein VG735_11775 [Caulobacterales bacterium]|jgi:hypothetical protein|nr:hypothetical protein [Caulobacterales bacterium]